MNKLRKAKKERGGGKKAKKEKKRELRKGEKRGENIFW